MARNTDMQDYLSYDDDDYLINEWEIYAENHMPKENSISNQATPFMKVSDSLEQKQVINYPEAQIIALPKKVEHYYVNPGGEKVYTQLSEDQVQRLEDAGIKNPQRILDITMNDRPNDYLGFSGQFGGIGGTLLNDRLGEAHYDVSFDPKGFKNPRSYSLSAIKGQVTDRNGRRLNDQAFADYMEGPATSISASAGGMTMGKSYSMDGKTQETFQGGTTTILPSRDANISMRKKAHPVVGYLLNLAGWYPNQGGWTDKQLKDFKEAAIWLTQQPPY